MVKVKMKADFMDWKKGEVVELKKELADRYINKFNVCTAVKRSPRTKQITAAPVDKQVEGAAKNK